MTDRLWHLTLNTGHVAATARSEVSAAVIDRLLPLVDADGGAVPGMEGVTVDLFRPLDDSGRSRRRGAAFFQIDPPGVPQGSKTPMLMAIGCWREEMSAEAWEMMRKVAEPHRAVLGDAEVAAEPPTVPWLAALVLPWITVLPPADQEALGDLSRCLFWALVESE